MEFYGLDWRKTRLIIENCPHFAAHDVTLFPVPFFLRFVFVAARHSASAAGGCCCCSSFCSLRAREGTYISLRVSSPSSNNNGRWGILYVVRRKTRVKPGLWAIDDNLSRLVSSVREVFLTQKKVFSSPRVCAHVSSTESIHNSPHSPSGRPSRWRLQAAIKAAAAAAAVVAASCCQWDGTGGTGQKFRFICMFLQQRRRRVLFFSSRPTEIEKKKQDEEQVSSFYFNFPPFFLFVAHLVFR